MSESPLEFTPEYLQQVVIEMDAWGRGVADGTIKVRPSRQWLFENGEELEMTKSEELLRRVVSLIHSDIFVKTPRGQCAEGETVQFARYKEMLDLRDEIVDHLEDMDR